MPCASDRCSNGGKLQHYAVAGGLTMRPPRSLQIGRAASSRSRTAFAVSATYETRVAVNVGDEDLRAGGRRSLLGDSGPAESLESAFNLDQIRWVVAHRSPGSPNAGDGVDWVERETSLDSGMRLVKSTKQHESGGQIKICRWKISICLD